jgi:cytochrome o ubiquinol oxidase subunit 2
MKAFRIVCSLLATGPAAVLAGCGLAHAPVLDPHGPVALTERNLLFIASGLMLLVVVPVFVMTFLFARRFRASNAGTPHLPDWSYSARLDAVVWSVPSLIVAVIGCLLWTYTHGLDPYRRSAGVIAPLMVEAIAEDWKWLFIYPEQNIAAVNELVFPSDRPLRIELTSDTVMNAFYVPGLVGQIYTMAGMRTELNLSTDGPAEFVGWNTQYSGGGFPDQRFAVRATARSQFDSWVAMAKRSPNPLDAAADAALAKPSSKVPVTYFSAVEPHLFAGIIAKYSNSPMSNMNEPARGAPAPSGTQ